MHTIGVVGRQKNGQTYFKRLSIIFQSTSTQKEPSVCNNSKTFIFYRYNRFEEPYLGVILQGFIQISYIIKGKIQHDWTFTVAAAINFKKKIKFNLCNVAKLKQDYRVAKKLGVGLG